MKRSKKYTWGAYMNYVCTSCSKSYELTLEYGIEGGLTPHKPAPNLIKCPHCGKLTLWSNENRIRRTGSRKLIGSHEPYLANIAGKVYGVPTHMEFAKAEESAQDIPKFVVGMDMALGPSSEGMVVMKLNPGEFPTIIKMENQNGTLHS